MRRRRATRRFAPGSVGGYADNAEAGASRRRWVAGTDFEFHVAGAGARQLWLFGETVNGVRAADVDCAAENPAAVCGTLTDQPGDQFRYVLENASSKEALFGLRLELARLNADTDFATRFYVTGQLGVMMLTGSVIVDLAETGAPDMVEAQEAYSAHHVGAGLLNRDFRFACPGWPLYTPEGRRAHETLFIAQSSSSRGRHLSPR